MLFYLFKILLSSNKVIIHIVLQGHFPLGNHNLVLKTMYTLYTHKWTEDCHLNRSTNRIWQLQRSEKDSLRYWCCLIKNGYNLFRQTLQGERFACTILHGGSIHSLFLVQSKWKCKSKWVLGLQGAAVIRASQSFSANGPYMSQ